MSVEGHGPDQRSTLLLGLEGLARDRVEVDGQGRPVAYLLTADGEGGRMGRFAMMGWFVTEV